MDTKMEGTLGRTNIDILGNLKGQKRDYSDFFSSFVIYLYVKHSEDHTHHIFIVTL